MASSTSSRSARASASPRLRSPDGGEGIGVIVFASPDAAASAARGPRSYPRDDSRAWNVEDVTVYEQLTSA